VTGAISSVSSEKLNAVPVGNFDQALQGRAAGLVVIANGAPGQAATLRVRVSVRLTTLIPCTLLMELCQPPSITSIFRH